MTPSRFGPGGAEAGVSKVLVLVFFCEFSLARVSSSSRCTLPSLELGKGIRNAMVAGHGADSGGTEPRNQSSIHRGEGVSGWV